MSAPTSYTVSYDFSGFQSINPADPLPAAEIDVEFAGIEASLTSVIAALADVRRADGRLENGVVTWDGLDADVRARITGEDRVTVGDLNAGAFAAQPEAYRKKVIGRTKVKIAIEAAIRQGWDAIIGSDGHFVGMEGFGASGPINKLYAHFGITPEAVAAKAKAALKR
jgi:hypothetical protein